MHDASMHASYARHGDNAHTFTIMKSSVKEYCTRSSLENMIEDEMLVIQKRGWDESGNKCRMKMMADHSITNAVPLLRASVIMKCVICSKFAPWVCVVVSLAWQSQSWYLLSVLCLATYPPSNNMYPCCCAVSNWTWRAIGPVLNHLQPVISRMHCRSSINSGYFPGPWI